ncbi:hypothetical protein ACFL2T_05170 [Elusimicrobiota bacterium]
MIEELSDLLDSRVRFHDKHRFEIKLDLTLHVGQKNVYHVDTYFFVPRSLNIGPKTFSRADFYNHCQRYVRFRAPKFDFSMILDPELESSPLRRIKRAVPSILAGKKNELDSTYYELRMLGCVSRASLRDQVHFLYNEIHGLPADTDAGGAKLSTIDSGIKGLMGDVRRFVSEVRELRLDVTKPVVPVKLRDTFQCLDEFFSLVLVDHLTILLETIREEKAVRGTLPATEKLISETIIDQNEYRSSMGYPSVVHKGKRNETIGYRRGILKKFISGPLFLQIETSEWEGTAQLFYGLAAGVAMLFTVFVMALAQSRYAINSAAFMAVAVISYIFKDRIKDWLKLWLVSKWTKWVADRTNKIWDPETKEHVGVLKEAFSFLSPDRVPPEIVKHRNADNLTSIDEEGKPEWVMKYEKEVCLYPSKIRAGHERVSDINDILRFNLFPFLGGADDPTWDYLHVDKDTGQMERIPCARVYHINMIRRYSFATATGTEQESYERFRIVFDRDGIDRVEEAPLT